jgi:hypothetical protein
MVPCEDPGLTAGILDHHDRAWAARGRGRGRLVLRDQQVAGDDCRGESYEKGEGCPVAEYRWLPVLWKNEDDRVAPGRTACVEER